MSCGVGGGLTDRSRLCDSPSPDHGGAYCSGDGTEETRCNDFNCPSKFIYDEHKMSRILIYITE